MKDFAGLWRVEPHEGPNQGGKTGKSQRQTQGDATRSSPSRQASLALSSLGSEAAVMLSAHQRPLKHSNTHCNQLLLCRKLAMARVWWLQGFPCDP